MNVYDQNGNLLKDYDLERGYLKEGTRTVHHEAVEGVKEVGHLETVREYPETGGEDVRWVIDTPGIEARDAWDEEIPIQVYVPYTDEELEEIARRRIADEQARQAAVARQEITDALIAAQINMLVVDDATALRWRAYYPVWTPEAVYAVGDKVQRADKLYKCLQGHTAQEGWEPEIAASLWEVIDETHAGTPDDPIPYDGNMELVDGRYYAQDGVLYRCVRGTGQPVHNALRDLVGLYVTIIG